MMTFTGMYLSAADCILLRKHIATHLIVTKSAMIVVSDAPRLQTIRISTTLMRPVTGDDAPLAQELPKSYPILLTKLPRNGKISYVFIADMSSVLRISMCTPTALWNLMKPPTGVLVPAVK